MPIYEYRCDDCGNHFEEIRPMQERELPCACPRCAGARSHLLLSTSFSVVRGPTARSAAARTAAPMVTDPGEGEHPHTADYVEPRHPLPAHWSRYPRHLGEAI